MTDVAQPSIREPRRSRLSRWIARLVVALIVAACSSTAPSRTPVTAPASSAPAAESSVLSAAPSPAGTPSASPQASDAGVKVDITHEVATYQGDPSSPKLNYVVEVKNIGAAYADIHAPGQTYTVSTKDGRALATGTFTFMFPTRIGPGETGYYIASVDLPPGTKSTDVGPTKAQIAFTPTDPPETLFGFSNVTFAPSNADPASLQVNGTVKDTTSVAAPQAIVGVVAFDAGHRILGGLVEDAPAAIEAHGSREFRASNPPLHGDAATVASSVAGAMPGPVGS